MLKKLILLLSFILPCSYIYSQNEVKILAHRGASALAPENTLAAFRLAIEYKADYIELDVHLSSDDSLMIIHDNTVDRTTNGKGKVQDMTYQQLKALNAHYPDKFDNDFINEKIPTLFEALSLAKDQIKVCIEFKASGLEEKVLILIRQMNMEKDIYISSFTIDHLKKIKFLNNNIPVLYLQPKLTKEGIDEAANINAQAVGPGFLLGKSKIDYAHEKGMEVWKWTDNRVEKMENLIEKGVDAIMTDNPQKLYVMQYVKILAYPNPFSADVSITTKNLYRPADIFIYNSKSEIIETFKNVKDEIVTWNVDSSGIYILSANPEGINISTKIIKTDVH